MTSSPPSRGRSFAGALLPGLLGGLVVLVLGAVLIATDVIDTGDTRREVVQQAPIARPAADSNEDSRTVADIYRQEGRGVVFVAARGASGEPSIFGLPREEGTATGSGVVVDAQGTILTNAHVVEGSEDVSVRFDEEGEAVDAEVKGRDPSTDLAVLQVDPDDVDGGLDPIPLGDSDAAEVGDPVIAIGNPFGYTRTVTTGIVSAKQRQITAPNGFPIRNVLQTDASINPGNSGGPLLDASGRVLGINSQIATGGGSGSVGIGFAVPVNTAKDLLPRLRRGEEVRRAWLGIEMAQVTEDVARELDLPADSGALVQQVVPGGPADDAGLRGGSGAAQSDLRRGGDLIVAIDGKAVRDPDDVADAIASKRPGSEVELELYRGDRKRTVSVELGERPDELTQESGSSPGGPDGDGILPQP